MIYTLQNDRLTVQISDKGAEICSVKDKDGAEWLWQGDPAFWEDHAPVLFPYCGRVWNSLCTVNGVPCNLGLHGFFMHQNTEGAQASATSVTFTLRESTDTLAVYPFPFVMKMIYTLDENTLNVRAEIKNTGTRTMPYGYGVHPGFCLPAAEGAPESFYLEFPQKDTIRSLCMDESECYPTVGDRAFLPQNSNRFYFPTGMLSAILRDGVGEVSIGGDHSSRRITLRYPDFPYLTLWKPEGGSFICVEPWTSLPSTFGKPTELTEKADLLHLQAGEINLHEFSIRFGE